MNREQKQKANRKRYIYEKYINLLCYLYQKYVKRQKWNYCCDLVAMQVVARVFETRFMSKQYELFCAVKSLF